jgi:hypothetical protein
LNKPSITNKFIIIDEEPVKPTEKTYTRKKNPFTKTTKDKSKKGGLIINKNKIIGKNKVLTRKHSKKDMKITNPKIGSKGNEPKHIQTQSQSKKNRKNILELMAEETSSILHRKLSI